MAKESAVRRVLLKISGEVMGGSHSYGIDEASCKELARSVQAMVEGGIQVALVMGAGNLFRGVKGVAAGMPRIPADQMGMLATMINGIALREALMSIGCPAKVLSAFECGQMAEPYSYERALDHLASGKVVILTGGTGSPFFTTDTAAALRASEIQAQLLLKATCHVDGVYNKDPVKHRGAKRYDQISHSDMLQQRLGVMDLTSVTLCMVNQIPIRVFRYQPDRKHRAVLLKAVSTASKGGLGTIIKEE